MSGSSHHSEPADHVEPAEPGDWRDMLRARGYRLTPQRQLVLEAVTALGHATPDEVLVEVQRTAGAVNASTVYRTLELLGELGLVTHTHLGHGAPTYHPASAHHHLHLVCRSCGGVQEVSVDAADAMVGSLQRQHGFITDVNHFAIFGQCAACRASELAGTPGTVTAPAAPHAAHHHA